MYFTTLPDASSAAIYFSDQNCGVMFFLTTEKVCLYVVIPILWLYWSPAGDPYSFPPKVETLEWVLVFWMDIVKLDECHPESHILAFNSLKKKIVCASTFSWHKILLRLCCLYSSDRQVWAPSLPLKMPLWEADSHGVDRLFAFPLFWAARTRDSLAPRLAAWLIKWEQRF